MPKFGNRYPCSNHSELGELGHILLAEPIVEWQPRKASNSERRCGVHSFFNIGDGRVIRNHQC